MEQVEENSEVVSCLNTLLNNLQITTENSESFLNYDVSYNLTSNIEKFYIKGKDKYNRCITLDLIAKVAPKYLPYRNIFDIDKAYRCEIFMYNTILPLFSKMQLEANVTNGFTSCPKYFISSNKYLNEVLVLEYMKEYKIITTLNYDEANILMKEVGKLHAMSFLLRKRDSKFLLKINKEIRHERKEQDARSKFIKRWFDRWRSRLLNILDSENEKLDIFNVFFESIDSHLERFYNFDSLNKYGVIGHCDYWPGNLLFKYDQDYPTNVCIIDWQNARICSPAYDVSDILFRCCDKKLRNDHREDLINAYYDSCSLHLKQFGEDINELFPFKVLEQHLKLYSGHILSVAIAYLPMLFVSPNDIPDISLARDCNDAINMLYFPEKDMGIMKDTLVGLLEDYARYGYDM